MTHAKYVGPLAHLRGRTALVMSRKNGWAAQFDGVGLARKPGGVATPLLDTDLGFGWHRFSLKDFEVEA